MGNPHANPSIPAAMEAEAQRRILATGRRPTPLRLAAFASLLSGGRPLSHQEIMDSLKDHMAVDRVTLYRTLDWLVAQKLVHKITADDRIWRFSAADTPTHTHPHFHCAVCGQVSCLAGTEIPTLRLPPGYHAEGVELVVNGHCPRCAGKGHAPSRPS